MNLQFAVEKSENMPKVIIKGAFYGEKCLPGLNEYLSECGRNPRAGGKLKKDYQMIACNAIRRCLKGWKTTKPLILHYRFFEPNRGQKRDRMNIFSFADKVFEDALQVCRTIPNDDPAHIVNTTHDYFYGEPKIEIYIEEIE